MTPQEIQDIILDHELLKDLCKRMINASSVKEYFSLLRELKTEVSK